MKYHRPYLIIDGTNSAYRSAAVLDLTGGDGRNVSVTFGLLRSIRYEIEHFEPRDMVVVWDGGRSESRKALVTDYKRSPKRVKGKTDFDRKMVWDNIEITQKILTKLGVPQSCSKGVEADDIIAKLSDFNKNSIISSSDKDFYQLINGDTCVYNPIKGILITPVNFAAVIDIDGILTPDQYLEYHIMMGDKGDNIPGVEGLGKKTASELISKYHTVFDSVQAVVADIDMFPKRARGIVTVEAKLQLSINRQVIDLRQFLSEGYIRGKNLLEMEPKSRHKEVKKMFEDPGLNFKSMLKNLNAWLLPFRKLALRRKLDGTH